MKAYPSDKGQNRPMKAYPSDKGQNRPMKAYPSDKGQNRPMKAYPSDKGQNRPMKAYPSDKGQNRPMKAYPSDKIQDRRRNKSKVESGSRLSSCVQYMRRFLVLWVMDWSGVTLSLYAAWSSTSRTPARLFRRCFWARPLCDAPWAWWNSTATLQMKISYHSSKGSVVLLTHGYSHQQMQRCRSQLCNGSPTRLCSFPS